MLTPGQRVLIRRRGHRDTGPWLVSVSAFGDLRFSITPDAGWLVHPGGQGSVLLESLALGPEKKARFLSGLVRDELPQAVLRKRGDRPTPGLCWKAHPTDAKTFLLECQSKLPGPKWLAFAERSGWALLTGRPGGRSLEHELVALPADRKDDYLAAEEAGDYSFMAEYGMAADGWPLDVARPRKARRALTPTTPRRRAAGDPVALELVAALQPSFDDAKAGEECSDYGPDDARRVGWPHNIISLDTVATPSGAVRLRSARAAHEPPAGELALCRRLAAGVVRALGGLSPFGGDSPTAFLPFYLAIGSDGPAPEGLTAQAVRAAFGGTIFPDTPINVYAVTWAFLGRAGSGWAPFVRWAAQQTELAQLSYVEVGYDAAQGPNLAAVFPRLVLGLTKAGSLAGACGTIVQA